MSITSFSSEVIAQTASNGDGDVEQLKPVTAADPRIPADYLELLVKPLTKEELVVEADAWRDLVKAKVQQVAQQQ